MRFEQMPWLLEDPSTGDKPEEVILGIYVTKRELRELVGALSNVLYSKVPVVTGDDRQVLTNFRDGVRHIGEVYEVWMRGGKKIGSPERGQPGFVEPVERPWMGRRGRKKTVG